MTRLAWSALLGAVFLAMAGSFGAADVAIALGVGWLGTAIARLPARDRRPHLAALPRFLAGALAAIAVETGCMMRVLARRAPPDRSGVVTVPLGERSACGAALSALVASSAPGMLALDVDEAARTMRLHAVDASDPERIAADLDRFYRRWQRPLAP